MPNDPVQNSQEDVLKSQVALRNLRDYVYQQKPVKMLASDFVEDIPSLRPFGAVLSDVLPTAATISKDPEERKKQIAEAMKSMTHHAETKHSLLPEILSSSAKFGLGSIPFSLGLGLAEKAFHVPGATWHPKTWKPKYVLNEKFRDPIQKQELKKSLTQDVLGGIQQGALFGAFPPLISRAAPFDKKHVETAGKVLQEHPNVSALPGADYAAVSNQYKTEKDNPTKDHLKNIGGGALTGAAWAGYGAAYDTGTKVIRNAPHYLFGGGVKHLSPKIRESYKDKPDILKSWEKVENQVKPVYRTNELLASFKWKNIKKPLIGLPILAGAAAGLGSYLTHPSRKKNEHSNVS